MEVDHYDIVPQPVVLTLIGRRIFLDFCRRRGDRLAELEAEVVDIAFRRWVLAEFVYDGSEVGQRTDG